MAEIITSLNLDKDEKFESLSKQVKKQKEDDHPIKEQDASKTIMTRTIIPNKRPVEKRDVEKIVDRIKGKVEKKKTEKVENNITKPKKKVEKKRGRPSKKNE